MSLDLEGIALPGGGGIRSRVTDTFNFRKSVSSLTQETVTHIVTVILAP